MFQLSLFDNRIDSLREEIRHLTETRDTLNTKISRLTAQLNGLCEHKDVVYYYEGSSTTIHRRCARCMASIKSLEISESYYA